LPLRTRAISESTTGRRPSGSISDKSGPPRIAISHTESGLMRAEQSDAVMQRLQHALNDAKARGAQDMKLDRAFVEAIVVAWTSKSTEVNELRSKFDSEKRTSRQYIDGLSVAQTEYDRELKARREAEAEVTRLRVLLSGQAARLTALSGDSRRQELRQKVTREMDERLSGLEQDLSKLKVERDMTLAEVEELNTAKSPTNPDPPANLGRTLSMRLDNIKTQYQHDLVPLTQQREALQREIAELKAVRDVFLEETTTLNARNEELAQLSAQYTRKLEMAPETPQKQTMGRSASLKKKPPVTPQPAPPPAPPIISGPMNPVILPPSASDDSQERAIRVVRLDPDMTPNKAKWFRSKAKEAPLPGPDGKGTKGIQEHNFQQLSILRFTRCDHCGDKMWGSQLRCTVCNVAVHVRCLNLVQTSCSQQHPSGNRDDSQGPLPPSIFGRDLVEQVQADGAKYGAELQVPIIVEKCIDAVEASALDYEGIYRKTGGSNSSKAITQLFERGDYMSFDLRDSDRFNDICSVTSVLKSYFRALPNPLLTFELHEQFMSAVEIKDIPTKNKALLELVNSLPPPHYYTLRMLMLHLHRIFERAERNLMNARNLGVVFGPTLMRSSNPGAEFSDMAGKALTVEWLVENAPFVFKVST
ncbi:Rho GTPase activation protein, partial [Schizophyllum fasciatum]